MLLLVLSKLKLFASILLQFFNTKLGQAIGLILIACFALWYVDNRAYNKGIEYQKNVSKEVYEKALASKLKEKEIVYVEVIKEAEKVEAKEKEIKTKAKTKEIIVEKIIEKETAKVLPDDKYNKLMEQLKENQWKN